MTGLGSGQNGEWKFLDSIAILSYFIGVQNLDLNVTQENLDRQTADVDAIVNNRIESALSEIHSHLKIQDEKLNTILKRLEDIGDDSRGNL